MGVVVHGRVVRGGLVLALAGLVLALSSPGTASATPPASIACDPLQPTSTSVTVDPGTQVTLTLLGIPLTTKVFTASGPLSAAVGGLLNPLCKVAVTVLAPVASAVPTAVTGPVASAVAPVASAVQAAPPVSVPIPGGGSVQLGGATAPTTTSAPATGGGAQGPGSTVPGSAPTSPGTGAGNPAGAAGAAPGGAAGSLLPGSSGPSGTTSGSASAPGGAGSPDRVAAGGLPSVFGSPVLAGFTTSAYPAQLGSLGTIPVARAASESSVQALDAQLGNRPALVVLVAVLALAATAGCTVRQWVLRAVPSLGVVPVTKGAHRR